METVNAMVDFAGMNQKLVESVLSGLKFLVIMNRTLILEEKKISNHKFKFKLKINIETIHVSIFFIKTKNMNNLIKFFFYIVILNTTNFYSQVIEINYQQNLKNSSIELYKQYDLILTDSLSIYVEKNSNSVNNENETNNNEKTYNINVGNKSEKNIYLNLKNTFYFKETFFGKPLKIRENNFNNEWAVMDSVKYISDFKCNLAKKKFRGRTYYAWYTEEILTNFGPWKINGLGGLVLEVTDEKKEFSINALNLKFLPEEENKYTNLIKSISKEFGDKKEIISIKDLKDFINEKNKIILNRLKQQLPRGIASPKLSTDCDDCNDSLEKY